MICVSSMKNGAPTCRLQRIYPTQIWKHLLSCKPIMHYEQMVLISPTVISDPSWNTTSTTSWSQITSFFSFWYLPLTFFHNIVCILFLIMDIVNHLK